DERPGTAPAEHHPVRGARERLEQREERTTGNVGGEVEVHAPGGDEGLQLAAFEVLLDELARRLRGEPAELERPAPAVFPHSRKERPARRERRQRRAEKRKERRRVSREPRGEVVPGLGVRRREVADRGDRLGRVRRDAEEAAVGEDRAERTLGDDGLEAACEHLVAVLAEE